MQSTRRRPQAGQSITEVAVATALLGIAFVVALGAIDVTIGGGRQAVHQAWAQCIVRETTGAVRQASWAGSYGSPDRNVRITVDGPDAPGPSSLQTVTVAAQDPDSGRALYSATFLKSFALRGDQPIDGTLTHLNSGCPRP